MNKIKKYIKTNKKSEQYPSKVGVFSLDEMFYEKMEV